MNEFFIFFEGDSQLLITFLIACLAFALLLLVKFPKFRKLLWVIYIVATTTLAFNWKNVFFPVDDPVLPIFTIPTLICWIFFIFFSAVFLIGTKINDQVLRKIGGLVMIVVGAAIIIATAQSLFYRDFVREENYKRQMSEIDTVPDSLKTVSTDEMSNKTW